ncbi:MAG: bifunctional 2',3'-cyclic-nucleotide 2'-phosphodiesterase/3'-nucleotidase [Roseovarius sp.]
MTDALSSAPAGDDQPATVHLRVLATSDMHGHVLPFDYFTHETDRPHGLARIATLVRAARREAGDDNCLLLDNGDFLQGTALSDLTPQPGQGWRGRHPVLRAMNAMGYDAATLGNHEFNFGLDWLRRVLGEASFPLTCANVVTRLGATPQDDETLLPPYIILPRQMRDTDGTLQTLRIGLIGLTPPQIMTWDHAHLANRLTARDMLDCARAFVPVMRREGADLVIALAHTGLETDTDQAVPDQRMQENVARAIAGVPGIDAIIAGHSHLTFPDADHADTPGADITRGTLCDVPCVIPGFAGSHLGQLDIHLTRGGGAWRVTRHHAGLVSTDGVAPCPRLARTLARAHAHTVRLTDRIVAHTAHSIHSYLSLVQNDLGMQLVNDAQRGALGEALENTTHASLPVLSATAPFKTGGRAGPAYYTDIHNGPLRLRNIADLYGFPNTLCGLIVSGADLRDWLERSAICFNTITPGQTGQMLLDPGVPGHAFDVIDGLSYRIDLSQPARVDAGGTVIAPGAQRIRDLCHAGRPVADTDRFVIATNSYRAWGGGPFRALAAKGLIYRGRLPIREMIAEHLAWHGTITARPRPIWGFAALPDTEVEMQTGPGLRAYPEDIAALGATDLGTSDAGFLRLRLPLGPRSEQPTLADPELRRYIGF